LCRSDIIIRTVSEDFENQILDISINSEKGKSQPIQQNELQILKSIFGNFKSISYQSINIFDKILCQNYINNCWWIGVVRSHNNHQIIIDNAIYLQRNNGNIYKSEPPSRKINLSNKDNYFLISNTISLCI